MWKMEVGGVGNGVGDVVVRWSGRVGGVERRRSMGSWASERGIGTLVRRQAGVLDGPKMVVFSSGALLKNVHLVQGNMG